MYNKEKKKIKSNKETKEKPNKRRDNDLRAFYSFIIFTKFIVSEQMNLE